MTTIPVIIVNSNSPPWTAQATLDGNPYQLSLAWNIAGQRWYLQIADQSGNIVWYGPFIGSPLNSDIFLAPGIFQQSTILFRADSGNIEVTP